MASRLRDSLEEMVARFGTPPRTIAVADTNVLLHHKPMTDAEWTEVVGAKEVTLVGKPAQTAAFLESAALVGRWALRSFPFSPSRGRVG